MESAASGQQTDTFLANHWWLFRLSRSSVLLIGPEHETDRAIQSITARGDGLIAAWPEAGTAPPSAAAAVTLLVRNAAALDAHEQLRLHQWLGERSGTVRVIATSPVPLYGLVERRQFLEPLYYRLNVVCVESAGA